MIKIVDGKRYNTETAKSVCLWSNSHSYTDFARRSKELFRTKTGAWFLHHEGGALSDMAVNVGSNETGGSEDIEPVSDDDAFGFLQAHSVQGDAIAAIEEFFSDRVEDA